MHVANFLTLIIMIVIGIKDGVYVWQRNTQLVSHTIIVRPDNERDNKNDSN
jgi:hypothetical protein